MEKEVIKWRMNELYRESGEPTQKDFADKCGVSRAAMQYYLKGDRAPDVSNLAKICTTYNVSSDWILGLTDIKTPDADIISICEHTGLSEEAVNFLVQHREHTIASTISKAFESENFIMAMASYGRFLKALEEIDHVNGEGIYDTFSYRVRPDGRLILTRSEYVQHLMFLSSRQFSNMIEDDYVQRMKEIASDDYLEAEYNEYRDMSKQISDEIEATKQDLNHLEELKKKYEKEKENERE